MVAILSPGTSLRRAFQYNENKVKEGKASLLLAENFPRKGFEDSFLRYRMLEKMAAIRPDVSVNSLHLSLNFAPGETLEDSKINSIARDYMEAIGFGNQPYLVYRHRDAGHPHCHIVTTNIEADGNRISLHHLGRLKSEPARKMLERRYGLVKAEEHKKQVFDLKPIDVTRVQYGKSELKRAMSNVLGKVIGTYRFTSLGELNAALRLYNMEAFQGDKDSRSYKNGGLYYRVLDGEGKPVGIPIKASLFYNSPTIKKLESLYPSNREERKACEQKLKSRIRFALKEKEADLDSFNRRLKQDGITVVARTTDDGLIYGLTYVDLWNKVVFNGSDLGKEYSAKGVLETLASRKTTDSLSQVDKVNEQPGSSVGYIPKDSMRPDWEALENTDADPLKISEIELTQLLTRYEFSSNWVPYQWRRKKKKKKAKGISIR